MLASGERGTCSPTENAELFGLADGRLRAVRRDLDLEVAMVDNLLLRPTYEPDARRPARPALWRRRSRRTPRAHGLRAPGGATPSASCARRCSSRSGRRRAAAAGGGGRPDGDAVARDVPRADRLRGGQARALVRGDGGGARTSSGIASRNRLLNEPVANLAGGDRRAPTSCTSTSCRRTASRRSSPRCRTIIPRSRQDLLNVTLRYVRADHVSVLAYAPGHVSPP